MDKHKAPTRLSDLSDAQLADEVRKGNQAAFEEMTARYQGLISLVASRYSAAGFDHSDFMQEGLLALPAKPTKRKKARQAFAPMQEFA